MRTIIIALLLIPGLAFATNRTPPPVSQEQDQHQAQEQDQHQAQEQEQAQTATASSSNDGVTVGGDTSNVENNSSNIVLVPNNNTENCLRVFGFAFGKDGTSGGFGVPWRSAACDYEQAADDAFAAGERELGWYWKCHNKSLYKTFKEKGEAKEAAIEQCHDKMIGDRIKKLQSDLAFIQNERSIERQKCSEAKNRIIEGCSK